MFAEHHKKGTTNPANKAKHEKGQKRKQTDKYGGEKGDARRIPRKDKKKMKNTVNKEILETIQYHIDDKMLLRVERSFGDEIDSIQGFPIAMSQKLLLMTVINDFHDEGFTILRLTDISDAYSKESDAFYEKICISENIGIGTSNIVQEITDFTTVLKQLIKYEGFISIQCETQIERCIFYLGKIIAIEQDSVVFEDIDMDGKWDDESHKILFDEITQITFCDNYSKMFYKYVKNK